MSQGIPVLVTTENRGVFFGYINPTTKHERTVDLDRARMCIYWRTGKGVLSLADTGPSSECKVSSTVARATLHNVTGVFDCTPGATEAWTTKPE